MPVSNAEQSLEESPRGAQLVVLFAEGLPAEPMLLRAALRVYDRRLAEAEVELERHDEAGVVAVMRWPGVEVELRGAQKPLDAAALEACLRHSHYGAELRERARAHRAHYVVASRCPSGASLEGYLACAAACGALASTGGFVVAHAAARTSVPAARLARCGPHSLDELERLALPLLSVGFGKYELRGASTVWLRTHAAHLFGLPDLAFAAASHDDAPRIAELFDDVLRHLWREGGALEAGHALEREGVTYALRALEEYEPTYAQAGAAFVLEELPAD
jgi:hypothetical protein